MRVKIADWISQSIGHSASDFKNITTRKMAEWVVSGYPEQKYPGVIIGAPGNAVSFLSGLTGFPFLPQPLLFNARRDMGLDDAQGYLDAGVELAGPLCDKNPDLEAIIHFDPVHDRFLIRRVVFIRTKFLDLPRAYRNFIQDKLVPNAPVILLDCQYPWPQAKVNDRVRYQLGGLGGFTPQEYIDEIEPLKAYRERWGADKSATWNIDIPYSDAFESEWGATGDFLDHASDCAKSLGHEVIRFTHEHPADLSKKVFNLYLNSWADSSPPRDVYTGVFTHTDPRFPLVTGALPIWLPFITDENLKIADEILSGWREISGREKPGRTAWITLHPSFCAPPDIVSLESWRTLYEKYFESVRFPGVTPGRYPFDLGSYVMMYPEMMSIGIKNKYPSTPFRTPSISDIVRIFS